MPKIAVSTIDAYVATLSPAEREQFKDLIADSQKREIEIKKNMQETKQYLLQLNKSRQQLVTSLLRLSKSTSRLEETLETLKDAADGLYLTSLPRNSMYS